jgi:hypothetical protein
MASPTSCVNKALQAPIFLHMASPTEWKTAGHFIGDGLDCIACIRHDVYTAAGAVVMMLSMPIYGLSSASYADGFCPTFGYPGPIPC